MSKIYFKTMYIYSFRNNNIVTPNRFKTQILSFNLACVYWSYITSCTYSTLMRHLRTHPTVKIWTRSRQNRGNTSPRLHLKLISNSFPFRSRIFLSLFLFDFHLLRGVDLRSDSTTFSPAWENEVTCCTNSKTRPFNP